MTPSCIAGCAFFAFPTAVPAREGLDYGVALVSSLGRTGKNPRTPPPPRPHPPYPHTHLLTSTTVNSHSGAVALTNLHFDLLPLPGCFCCHCWCLHLVAAFCAAATDVVVLDSLPVLAWCLDPHFCVCVRVLGASSVGGVVDHQLGEKHQLFTLEPKTVSKDKVRHAPYHR
jgi:hypothetical protein